MKKYKCKICENENFHLFKGKRSLIPMCSDCGAIAEVHTKNYKPRSRAICKTCGKTIMRNRVVRHNYEEHPESIKANIERWADHGGLGIDGHKWYHLADPLPGEVI